MDGTDIKASMTDSPYPYVIPIGSQIRIMLPENIEPDQEIILRYRVPIADFAETEAADEECH